MKISLFLGGLALSLSLSIGHGQPGPTPVTPAGTPALAAAEAEKPVPHWGRSFLLARYNQRQEYERLRKAYSHWVAEAARLRKVPVGDTKTRAAEATRKANELAAEAARVASPENLRRLTREAMAQHEDQWEIRDPSGGPRERAESQRRMQEWQTITEGLPSEIARLHEEYDYLVLMEKRKADMRRRGHTPKVSFPIYPGRVNGIEFGLPYF